MADYEKYRFKIDAYTPESIPMARLTEYMSDLAALFGETAYVHFDHLESGSTVIVSRIANEAIPKVKKRVESVRSRQAPQEALRAFECINRRLVEDNGSGVVVDEQAAEVIEFLGARDKALEDVGPFRQPGTIDGIIIRLGGKGQTVPMIVVSEGKEISGCRARRELALALRPYLMERPLRLHGEGRWRRDVHGDWHLDLFYVNHFTELDASSLSDTVDKLRSVRGAEWGDDPVSDIGILRHGTDEIR